MRRHARGWGRTGLLAALAALCLAAQAQAAAPASAPPQSHWWDTADADITTVSSGTGGMPGTFVPALRAIGRADTFSLAEEWTERIDAAVQDWAEALFDAEGMVIRETEQDVVDGRLMQYGFWESAFPFWESAERVRWRMRTAVVDARTGERLGLSQLFYDGFNYIRYINEQAALALLSDRWTDPGITPVTEEMLRRPFSGFPRDYPYFRLREGEMGGRVLELLVDAVNPLFDTGKQYEYPCILIPLPDTVSPYGEPWADVTVDRGQDAVHVARVSLPEGKDTAVAARINEALQALAERALLHPMILAEYDWERPMVPRVYLTERYLCASYYGSESWREGDQATMAALCVDMETGRVVDGEAAWQSGLAMLAGEAAWLAEEALEEAQENIEMRQEYITARFDNWRSEPEEYEAPPLAEMVYLGCSIWRSGSEGLWMGVLYFDPAVLGEHWMYLPLSALEEVPLARAAGE